MNIHPPIRQAYKLLNAANKDCPVKTGYLKSTGRVEITGINEVIARYYADYGVYIHENPKSIGFKWLEKNAISMEEELVEEYADEILKELWGAK